MCDIKNNYVYLCFWQDMLSGEGRYQQCLWCDPGFVFFDKYLYVHGKKPGKHIPKY